MYLEQDFTIDQTSPCMADPSKFKAITRAERDLEEMREQLRQVLRG